ncbi:oxygen-independent coproporphyrinogen III oxidase [Chitinilyticum piscinae]|uniref:Coproporphyrinogen-III oxidase n=1 Tax=Chitinilyticum piscinae TaxID=2866724 RepID=A0A8J7K2J8_9NEIS|nr:oxygen-independent coproporphyrinogen III oxidase [Chitinilyticum piscinae]MBE9610117.1 oxygen-independent coproporphyrinogen III oxidase [Chitinilyticum piscinae]
MALPLPPAQTEHLVFDRELIVRYDGNGPRYTSYPTADRFGPGFGPAEYRHVLQQRAPGTLAKPLSLYFHLPFCNTVCYYCACNKVITKDKSRADQYLDYLIREINLQADLLPKKGLVRQLHFGGGTPTFLSHEQLERLMAAIRQRFDLQQGGEFSIEIDPRKVGMDTVQLLAQLGFNRMSVGIQDFEPAVQEAVNRIQSYDETRVVIEAARMYGFKSVSVDLIYGLPKQTLDSIARTLELVIQLRPERISLYNYAHLPERFMPQRRINAAELPSPETKLDILQMAIARLEDAGYVFIGMDHFALPSDELTIAQRRGRLHRNFQGYSTHADCDLLAFGVSAIGKVGASYNQNTKELDDYYARLDAGDLPVVRGMHLGPDDLLRRAVIQALMCQFEVYFQPFEVGYMIDFPRYFEEEFGLLQQFIDDGLVEITDEAVRVLPRGRLLVRSVAMVFDRYLRTRQTQARYSKLI